MRILITNDDGILAVGIKILAEHLRPLGHVTVVAPEGECSAVGRALTLSRPLRLRTVADGPGHFTVATDGTPTDCVLLGLKRLMPEPPDVILSGINSSPNLGDDVHYSGTVAAAMEGALNGIPSLAISLGRGQERDYSVAASVAARLAAMVHQRGLPHRTVLNVNVPGVRPEQIQGMEVTRQGRTNYAQRIEGRVDPWGQEYFWVTGDTPTGEPVEGTDFGALHRNRVSITPLAMQLTDHHLVEELSTWPI